VVEPLTRELANQLLEKGALSEYVRPHRDHLLCYLQGRAWEQSVPIGRPIANTQIYFTSFLNRKGDPIKPVPIGVPGGCASVVVLALGLPQPT